MKKYVKVRNVAPVAALVAVTATAWATNEAISPYGLQQLNPPQAEERVAVPAEPIATPESFAPNETAIPSNAAVDQPAPRVAPVAEAPAVSPPITVEEKRLTQDERIQADVMDRIANSQNLSGKIGVETRDAVVTLTGYTSTAFQAERAGRAARGVDGVRDVQNLIRARVGGSA